MTRRVFRVGLVLAAPVLLVLLLRAFVLDVYRVDSGSMEPTIHGAPEGGEAVLVRYDRAPRVERFDLVVVLREGEREPVVKRVVGLPGEEVRIVEGDLLVDGARLGPDVPRPPPVPVFRSDRNDLEQDFDLAGDWSRSRGRWVSHGEASASWRHALTDSFLLPDGQRREGRRQVGDAVLECALAVDGPAVVTLSLTEEGDEFVARIHARDEGALDAALLRRRSGGEELLAEESHDRDPGQPLTLRLSNVDDCLTLEIAGRRWLQETYQANEPLKRGPDPRRAHRRPRARLAISGDGAELLSLRLARDLHYTEAGTFGTSEPVRLGPSEVFLLGDNSAESVDGREWGPVTLGEILGRPAAVVWPPGRTRILNATAPPAQALSEQ